MPGWDTRVATIVAVALGGAALLLLAALLVTRGTLSRRTAERDKAVASLASCKAAVASQNAAIEALGKAGEAQRQAAERALEAAKAADGANIRALERSAQGPKPLNCATSPAFRQAVGAL